jgi:hypothetical protein
MSELLTLKRAAATLPAVRGDKPPHWITLYRWATVGLISKSGRRVRLKTWRVGKTVMTTTKAIRRFHAELEDAEPKEMPRSLSVTERQQQKRAAAAIAFLKSEGAL